VSNKNNNIRRQDKREELDALYDEQPKAQRVGKFSYKFYHRGQHLFTEDTYSLYHIGQEIQRQNKIFKITEIYWATSSRGNVRLSQKKSV